MHEDVAGQQAVGTGHRYSTCGQCGRSFLTQATHAETAGVLEDVRSEFTELCDDCERALREGEATAIPAVDG